MLKPMHLSELTQPLRGELVRGDAAFERVSSDTRTLQPGDLFVALSGPHFDGNGFVAQAAKAGAVAAVVSDPQPVDLPQLVVADTRQALGQLGALNRQAFDGPLVAVTGSSGKTSVKEMLASILGALGPVLATRGNLNNELGVPLTLLELAPEHRAAVVELGASGPGEIAYTVGLAQPQVAILNNAGGAHLEGFGSLEGVVRAKGEIFDGIKPGGTGVVNLDDPHAPVWLRQLQGRPSMTFSLTSAHADLFASHIEPRDDGCFSFVLNSHEGQVPVALKVLGRHAVANALAAACAARALGLSLEQVRDGLERFGGVAGRLVSRTTRGGARVIDDTYNANPDSVRAAIRVLAALPGARTLVLGNMAELGDDTVSLHREVGRFAAEQGVELVLTVGDLARHIGEGYAGEGRGQSYHFADQGELVNWLRVRLSQDSVVLVKGSRSARMEQVVARLTTEESD